MDIFWKSLFSFLEKLVSLVVPLLAAYFGWRLSQKTYVRQVRVDFLKNKFEALREIKSVIDNIPPDLNEKALEERLLQDENFQNSLTARVISLFGLRNELIPFISPEFINLIDLKLTPLFVIENGKYTFKEEKTCDFASFAEEARSLVSSIESKLTEEYMQQLR